VSTGTPRPTAEAPKIGRKVLRSILAFLFAWMTLGMAGAIKKDLPHRPDWVRPVDAALFIVGGSLLVLFGVDCIRWRKQMARWWPDAPGGAFLSGPDPERSHRWRLVGGGVFGLLGGCLCIIAGVGVLTKSS
jgi:hypothetical protein